MSDPLTPEALTQAPESQAPSAEYIHAEFGKHGRKGKGSRVPDAQKHLIYSLADVAKLNTTQIAERLSMDWRTVSAVLNLRDHQAVAVTNLFKANALRVGQNWLKACEKGALKGRHEPARDLLQAIGVVQMPSQAQAHQSVTVILSGGEMPSELRVGIQQNAPLSPSDSE